MHALLLAILLALDLTPARSAFQELDAMCRADGGRMWNRSLCGPTILVDPASRRALTLPSSRAIATHPVGRVLPDAEEVEELAGEFFAPGA